MVLQLSDKISVSWHFILVTWLVVWEWIDEDINIILTPHHTTSKWLSLKSNSNPGILWIYLKTFLSAFLIVIFSIFSPLGRERDCAHGQNIWDLMRRLLDGRLLQVRGEAGGPVARLWVSTEMVQQQRFTPRQEQLGAWCNIITWNWSATFH